MNRRITATASILLLGILITTAFGVVSSHLNSQHDDLKSTVVMLQDSLARLQLQVDSLKQQVPGLGEYMSAIQLHISKLWFASKASNWDLASYELGELREAMDGAEALHISRNNVSITPVLQSLEQTQIPLLEQSVKNKQQKNFLTAYGQTLDACNGCHQAAGYKFIHVIVPTSPPVTNQQWSVFKN
jgi:hypothetical protein